MSYLAILEYSTSRVSYTYVLPIIGGGAAVGRMALTFVIFLF